jgi:hypothetical protein
MLEGSPTILRTLVRLYPDLGFFVSLIEDKKLPLYLLIFFRSTLNVNSEIYFLSDIKL